MEKMRIDKWLWCARFYKTRSLASEAIDKAQVRVNGDPVKPARDIKPGDTVSVRIGPVVRDVVVTGLSNMRGGAPAAALLYAETPESISAREAAAAQRKLAPEPALSYVQGRPTKRDRRELDDSKGWNDRWSASVDE
jgi:ribosome-associated heat shock protein Hsp15